MNTGHVTKTKTRGFIVRSAALAVVFSSAIVGLSWGFNLSGGWSSSSSHSGVLGGPVKPTTQSKTLTFADRVAYQRAIEEIYWRHRIWPAANAGAKPPLDRVMSHETIEKKVEDYLRNSQALEDYRHQPISREQLQAEMDRISHDTKQPEVLREIFDALGDDPAVIAECLARPVLAARLHTQADLKEPLDVRHAKSVMSSPSMAAVVPMTYTLPAVTSNSTVCFDNWIAVSNGEVSSRWGHTAVWTGSEMIIWGGHDGPAYVGGAKYDPTTDSWSLTSMTDEPHYRATHTAVWTGTEMIIWGGRLEPNIATDTNTGGRYNPTTDSWTATSLTNAPDPRDTQTAVWTGSEMIVWGGYTKVGYANTGGRYDPGTDSWTSTSLPFVDCSADGVCLLEGRYYHTAVWTGSEMIVWGGVNGETGVYLSDGGRYNPSTDTWIGTDFTTAPTARAYHTAIWTGTEMIVWGGLYCVPGGSCQTLNSGGRYNPDPLFDSWTATTTSNAPEARYVHTAVWTGNEMIVWGGLTDSSPFLLNTGGRYDPGADSWTDTTMNNAPEARTSHTAVWTGSEMIVWGGYNLAGHAAEPGGRYCGQAGPTPTPTPTATPTPTPCMGRCNPTPRPRPTPAPRPTPH